MIDGVYETFIAKSRYARYLDNEARRENWGETVDRYLEFIQDHLLEKHEYLIPEDLLVELRSAITEVEVFPSMRALMTAGEALERDNTAGFNCSYLPVDDIKSFDEAMYILMCGVGVGFSVERQYICKLPEVPDRIYPSESYIMVHDSKEGWAKALRQLIALLYSGEAAKWDVSEVRPAGARLKTFGGRASGPGPLVDLFRFVTKIFKGATGRKLTSLECHDIMCKIGEVVVVGGVRRCLPVGTLVNTINGSKPIETLTTKDYIVTGGMSYAVNGLVNSGKQKTIILKHRFGSIECTPNHKVAYYITEGEYAFKSASDIVVGDRLVWDSVGYLGEPQKLPINTEKLHFNAKVFTIPEFINKDVAWLIGLVHGDGHISNKGIEITAATHEEWSLEEARRIFEENFKVSGSISQGHGNCLRLRLNSSALARWFNLYVKIANMPIRIPTFILNATQDIRSAYLAGLFDSDGRGREDAILEQCTTIYKDLSVDVVHLLSTLGIGCTNTYTSTEKRRNTGINCHDFYTIKITGNTNRKNWVSKVAEYLRTEKLMVSSAESDSGHSSIDYSYPVSMLKSGYPQGYKRDGNILVTSPLLEKNYSPYLPTPITEILPGRFIDTYDIEVDTVHQFTVSGIVVHNSAMISLSNLSDDRMRHAKSGAWWEANPQRALANNSACYTERPDVGVFMNEWIALYESKSGERGIFNREAATKVAARNGRRDIEGHEFGTNPCSEIILRPYQFCNLSTIVVRAEDTRETLLKKIRVAAILGTFQSTLTNFPYLRKIWQKNTEEERLLGVSMTGPLDNKLLNNPDDPELENLLEELKTEAVRVNKVLALQIGIPQATAVSAIKPEGTTSERADSASGLHTRHAAFYIRRIRGDIKDPLTKFMMQAGVPWEPDVMKPTATVVFSFAKKAPKGALVKSDLSAIQHLKLWLAYQRFYCEHKPSITVSVKENEWPMVGAFVWEHFDEMSGVSFLPDDGGSYRQAPYEECTEEEYEELLAKIPKYVDWDSIIETDDNVEGAQTLACSAAGGCSIL